jgi:hypothetical protein
MRLPFCILNVLGDVLDDGELQFVEAARTLKAARRRIEALAKLSPGQYVIYNGQTGERMPIVAGAKLRPLVFEGRFGKTPAEQSNALQIVR